MFPFHHAGSEESQMIAVLPMVLSAVKSLLSYRKRVDDILATHEASAGLPFKLPPLPSDYSGKIDEAAEYFWLAVVDKDQTNISEENQKKLFMLELSGLTTEFSAIYKKRYLENRRSDSDFVVLNKIVDLYFAETQLPFGPGAIVSPPQTGAGGTSTG